MGGLVSWQQPWDHRVAIVSQGWCPDDASVVPVFPYDTAGFVALQ